MEERQTNCKDGVDSSEVQQQEAQNSVTNAISTSSNDEQTESGNYQLKRT